MAVTYFPPKLTDAQVLWIDAILGASRNATTAQCAEAEQAGLTVRTETRDGPTWEWSRAALARQPEERLAQIYASLKEGARR